MNLMNKKMCAILPYGYLAPDTPILRNINGCSVQQRKDHKKEFACVQVVVLMFQIFPLLKIQLMSFKQSAIKAVQMYCHYM